MRISRTLHSFLSLILLSCSLSHWIHFDDLGPSVDLFSIPLRVSDDLACRVICCELCPKTIHLDLSDWFYWANENDDANFSQTFISILLSILLSIFVSAIFIKFLSFVSFQLFVNQLLVMTSGTNPFEWDSRSTCLLLVVVNTTITTTTLCVNLDVTFTKRSGTLCLCVWRVGGQWT